MNIIAADTETATRFVNQVPDLVHATGEATYNYLFGADRILFNSFMKVSWIEPKTLFSHSETTLAVDGSELLGIEIGYGGADWYSFSQAGGKTIGQLFASGDLDEDGLRGLSERSNYTSYLNAHIPEHAYYIIALSVTEAARGTGIGAKLLTNAMDRAKQEGYKELQLDVFSDNPAVHFYQSMGLTCMAETSAPVPRENGVPMEMRMAITL